MQLPIDKQICDAVNNLVAANKAKRKEIQWNNKWIARTSEDRMQQRMDHCFLFSKIRTTDAKNVLNPVSPNDAKACH